MRQRHKILLTLGVMLASVALAAGLYHWHLKAVNEAYIAQLVAQGEPMSLAQVLPPPVPPSENSADIFLRAAEMLNADASLIHSNDVMAMLLVAPGKALVCSSQPLALGYESTNTWGELACAVENNHSSLDSLRLIVRHPGLDFKINYLHGMGDSMEFTNLHLGELKKAGGYLTAAAVLALHHGHITNAVEHQRTLLALIFAMKNQRFVISELVRMAMLSSAQKINWEILQAAGPTESQLAWLQSDWERLDFIQGCLDALIADRAASEVILKKWRQSAALVRAHFELEKQGREKMGDPTEFASPLEKNTVILKVFLWQQWWSYPDEMRSLKGYNVLLDTARLLATNESFRVAIGSQQAQLASLEITNIPDDIIALTHSFFVQSDFHCILSKSIVSLAGTFDRLLIAETTRQMTIAALALQRFKLAQGHFPTQLAELVPAYVTSIPRDPVDGQPLRYRLLADGNFLLYSVGENGVDDGGNPARADRDSDKSMNWLARQNLDWVWPQPVARPALPKDL